jgi:Cu-processing system permease protein
MKAGSRAARNAPALATRRLYAIARYTVLEGRRTGMGAVVVLVVLCAAAASWLVREIALIEAARMQVSTYALLARLAAVFIVAAHVVASLHREFNDKGLEAVLALDVPRWQYIGGKYAGYLLIASSIAGLAALPLLVLHGAAALSWLASLALETWVVAAMAMFAAVTLAHVPSAMAAVAGFYLLSRSMTGLLLVAAHPIAGGDALLREIVAGTLFVVGWLVPRLDGWTRTAWLVDASPGLTELARIAGEALVYSMLLLLATLLDFYRREV